MKKKVLTALIVLAAFAAVLAACGDGEESFSGTDEHGREYGAVCALEADSPDGWFRVPAASHSESAMGKMMVDATRLDYLTVIKTGEEYSLIYHATSTDMNNVRLVFDGEEMAAQAEKSGSLENYRFDKLTYEQLSGEIAVRVYVATMMERDTNFTLTLDLAQAVLVPEGTPAKEV